MSDTEVLQLVGYRRFQDPPNDAKANARNMKNTRYVPGLN